MAAQPGATAPSLTQKPPELEGDQPAGAVLAAADAGAPTAAAVAAATKAEPAAHLKAMSLIMVTLQTTTMVVLARFTRVGDRAPYSVCSMVILTEMMKVVLSLGLLSKELGGVAKATSLLRRELFHHSEECLKLLVPAGLYFFQNNVLIFAVTNLNTAQYQVCYQFKLVVTAVLSVIMLKRSLSKAQWISLVLLFLGIAKVNLSSAKEGVQAADQNPALGFMAVFAACFTSGMAGVYFEKLIKGGTQSVWTRNFFLAVFSLGFGGVNVLLRESAWVRTRGFFSGVDSLVLLLVCVNAAGGMIVGMVMKYADNILKGFATGISTLLSTMCSVVLFNFEPNFGFALGAVIVVLSTFMYSNAKVVVAPLPEAMQKTLLA